MKFFQHLKPASQSPASPEAVKDFCTLRDLDLKTGISAGTAELVKTGDGRVVQVPITLPTGQAELEAFDRDYGSTSIPTAGLTTEELEAKSRRLRNQIEGREEATNEVMIPDLENETLRKTQGWVVGIEDKPFQVVYLGGNRWNVSGGELRYTTNDGEDPETGTPITVSKVIPIPGVILSLNQGFVGFSLALSIVDENLGYQAVPSSIQGLATFSHNMPGRDITFPDEFTQVTTYSPGLMYIPLAYVISPNGISQPPKVINIFGQKQSISLSSVAYGVGLPNVS